MLCLRVSLLNLAWSSSVVLSMGQALERYLSMGQRRGKRVFIILAPAGNGPRHQHDAERPERADDGHVGGVAEKPPDVLRHHAERNADHEVLRIRVSDSY
jgi:hypothetical protein